MKICVIAHFAYGAISGGNAGHIGGVERQTSMVCKWLAAHGHEVSLLTWDEGQAPNEKIDGVSVIKMCRKNAGIPIVRFFHPRWTSLNKAMQQADADIYYHNCGEYVTGQVALWCRRNERKFVYSVASDPDCDVSLPEMKTFRERRLYKYGIRHAHKIIVQTDKQNKMLEKGFGLDSVILPMPCPGPSEAEFKPKKSPDQAEAWNILWVGRIYPVKRLEFLLDIAEKMPDVRFNVAGGPDQDNDYTRGLLSRGESLPNVTLYGRVNRDAMPAKYEQNHVMCCTSAYEGFPNTFLEAWSYGLPIISTVDPDGLIMKKKIGCVCHEVSEFVDALSSMINRKEAWREMSRNARRYYLENHELDHVMAQYEQVFAATLSKKDERINT